MAGALWGAGRESAGCVYKTTETYGPECSGFFERPKIAAVFAGSLGTEDCRFPENIPILSSLTNMPPILPVEDS